MPERVTVETDGVDFGWVMQVTFVVTITLGSLVVALLSLTRTLPTWNERALFAVRLGAVIWLLIATTVYLYARRREAEKGTESDDGDPADATDD